MSAQPYAVIATVPYADTDAAGDPVTRPAGTVANIVLWDGVSSWSPGDGFVARVQTTERIGDVVAL